MKPTKKQATWLIKVAKKSNKKFKEQTLEVIDVLPRAYCIAKIAKNGAVLVYPQEDFREPMSTDRTDPYYSGTYIGSREWFVPDVELGKWYTVAFCGTDGSCMYYVFPMIPLKLVG